MTNQEKENKTTQKKKRSCCGCLFTCCLIYIFFSILLFCISTLIIIHNKESFNIYQQEQRISQALLDYQKEYSHYPDTLEQLTQEHFLQYQDQFRYQRWYHFGKTQNIIYIKTDTGCKFYISNESKHNAIELKN